MSHCRGRIGESTPSRRQKSAALRKPMHASRIATRAGCTSRPQAAPCGARAKRRGVRRRRRHRPTLSGSFPAAKASWSRSSRADGLLDSPASAAASPGNARPTPAGSRRATCRDREDDCGGRRALLPENFRPPIAKSLVPWHSTPGSKRPQRGGQRAKHPAMGFAENPQPRAEPIAEHQGIHQAARPGDDRRPAAGTAQHGNAQLAANVEPHLDVKLRRSAHHDHRLRRLPKPQCLGMAASCAAPRLRPTALRPGPDSRRPSAT